MKYLKPFNENTDNFKEELQEFCEMNLAYLLDEAELQIIPIHYLGFNNPSKDEHLIRILLNEPKHWDDIKDHMIPFFTRLVNKYEISKGVAIKFYDEEDYISYSKEEILNDTIEKSPSLYKIDIQIK